ncbi:CGEA protein [Priestia megaterium]|uniref:CGEA protein n=1 Tax=Priestia megaterium TaxID=1404 RepID=UPI0030F3EE99
MSLELSLGNASINLGNSSLLNPPVLSTCQGTACFIFSRLIPGTTVTVVGDSSTFYGPATFVSFDPRDCAVTLREATGGTPGSTTTTVINCTKIESISFTS